MKLLSTLCIAVLSLVGSYGYAQSGEVEKTAELAVKPPVRLYPNPAIDFIHVEIEHVDVTDVRVSLHNIIGNEILADKEIVNSNTIRVGLKNLPAGYYLLVLKDDKALKAAYKFLLKGV